MRPTARTFIHLLNVAWILKSGSCVPYPDDALCLPVRVVNGVVSPFDYSLLGPYERVPTDFQYIPIGYINGDTIGVDIIPNGDRQLFSVISPAHREHTIVPCPYIWHTSPWKNPLEPAVNSTITVYDYPTFVQPGVPPSDILPVFIGEAFRPGPDTTLAALVALYAAATGPLWTRATGWAGGGGSGGAASNYCGWFGVECRGEDVIGISLADNGLAGTLPPAFFYYLPALRRLDLSGNRLIGRVPPDIGLCTLLTQVSVPAAA